MKESLNSNGETGHDCCENKVKTVMMKLVMIDMKESLRTVMVKLVMIDMKRKFKQWCWNCSRLLWKESLNSKGETGHDCYEKKV